ncbi:MAG: exodeoxyribonuclease III [Myxococcales bacterium]|nr:exodeoxyribonuclease III [Myxococcales bacterium]
MKIATWNVNSLRAREDVVLNWVEANRPDVLCMQETKVTDQEFPEDGFGDLDCETAFFGQPNYNGVAIASTLDLHDVVRGFPGDPPDAERRIISARIAGIDVISIYLPNGQAVDSEKYRFKLSWIDRLVAHLHERFDASKPVVLCGDFNIAPSELDHYWPASKERTLFTTPEERAAYARILDFGFVDAYRLLHESERAYTWWDYRGRTFQRNEGMRIDHLLVTRSLLPRVKAVEVHRDERAQQGPSDHVPVVLVLED